MNSGNFNASYLEKVTAFRETARSRFDWIKRIENESHKTFLFRIFFADLIRHAARYTGLTTHATVCYVASSLYIGDFPLPKNTVSDPEKVLKEKDVYKEYLRVLDQLNSRDLEKFSGKISAERKLENSSVAQSVSRDELSSRLMDNRGGLILSYLAKRVLAHCKLDTSLANYSNLRKTLLEWVDESNVPPLCNIDLSNVEFSEQELTTLARSDLIRSFPLTKKGMRHRRERQADLKAKNRKLADELNEMRNLINKIKEIKLASYYRAKPQTIPRQGMESVANYLIADHFSRGQLSDK
jgi:hypothetical protein